MCKPRAVAAGNWDVKRKVGELGKGEKNKKKTVNTMINCISVVFD